MSAKKRIIPLVLLSFLMSAAVSCGKKDTSAENDLGNVNQPCPSDYVPIPMGSTGRIAQFEDLPPGELRYKDSELYVDISFADGNRLQVHVAQPGMAAAKASKLAVKCASGVSSGVDYTDAFNVLSNYVNTKTNISAQDSIYQFKSVTDTFGRGSVQVAFMSDLNLGPYASVQAAMQSWGEYRLYSLDSNNYELRARISSYGNNGIKNRQVFTLFHYQFVPAIH